MKRYIANNSKHTDGTVDTIVFIGAGRVASQLAPALHRQGFRIGQVFSRTADAARTLAEKVGAGHTDDITTLDPTADIYIYAVSDSALPALAARVHAPAALHLHTSGSTGMDLFLGRADHYGVLYPLQTFSHDKAVRWDEVSFFLEGNDDYACRRVRALAQSLSRRVSFMDSAGRLRLHLAAVFVCNFVNHLYTIGAELMADAGADFDLLLPLIDETTEKLRTLAPYDAQTGPAVRNDRNIIDRHLALLEGKRSLPQLYRLLTDDIYHTHSK